VPSTSKALEVSGAPVKIPGAVWPLETRISLTLGDRDLMFSCSAKEEIPQNEVNLPNPLYTNMSMHHFSKHFTMGILNARFQCTQLGSNNYESADKKVVRALAMPQLGLGPRYY
jgi:hypothetical protein